MTTNKQAEVAHRLTWSDLGGGHVYEAWRTPEVAPGFHLYYYQGDVQIGRHPYTSDVAIRTAFERAVEDKYDEL